MTERDANYFKKDIFGGGFLQFLPIYTPSEEEKKNPALFAINVRRIMAKYVEIIDHIIYISTIYVHNTKLTEVIIPIPILPLHLKTVNAVNISSCKVVLIHIF